LRRQPLRGIPSSFRVREHHAPVGALRQNCPKDDQRLPKRQGAPRTCRCIETVKMRTPPPGHR